MTTPRFTPAVYRSTLAETMAYGQAHGLPMPINGVDIATPQVFGILLAHLPTFEVTGLADMTFDRREWHWLDLRAAVKDVTPTGMFHLAGAKAGPEYHVVTREQLVVILRMMMKTAKHNSLGLARIKCPDHPEGVALYQRRERDVPSTSESTPGRPGGLVAPGDAGFTVDPVRPC